jgi:hypothetical protein
VRRVLYTSLLFLHNLVRWVVLGAAVMTLAKPLEKRPGLVLVASIDSQVLIGLAMYTAVSPITQLALANMKDAMKDHALRFWAVEHPFAMLIALAAVHVGRVMAKRATDDAARKKRVVRSTAIALVALVVGMPWPFLPYGRSLLPHL